MITVVDNRCPVEERPKMIDQYSIFKKLIKTLMKKEDTLKEKLNAVYKFRKYDLSFDMRIGLYKDVYERLWIYTDGLIEALTIAMLMVK